MNEATEVTTDNKAEWNAAIAASAETDAASTPDDDDTVYDTIAVMLTDAEIVKMAKENADRAFAKKDLEANLESQKEAVKTTKAQIDALDAEMTDCHEAIHAGSEEREGPWRAVPVFEQNVMRFVDPETGLVVHERALKPSERQTTLFDTAHSPSTNGTAADSDASGETDLEDDRDSTTNIVDDPEGLLMAANEGATKTLMSPEGVDPPSKPTRRAKRTK